MQHRFGNGSRTSGFTQLRLSRTRSDRSNVNRDLFLSRSRDNRLSRWSCPSGNSVGFPRTSVAVFDCCPNKRRSLVGKRPLPPRQTLALLVHFSLHLQQEGRLGGP